MDDQKKEESMEGFTNLLGNFRVEKFFGASHNNSKDELNLLSDLLDLQKLDKDNLLDTKDFIALDPFHEGSNNARKKELTERAFKTELSLNSEPFIIFSRNNGIAKKPKKNLSTQSPNVNRRRHGADEMNYPETVENYMSLPLREDNNLDFTLQPPTMSTEMTNFESLGPNRNIISDIQNNNNEYPHRNVPEFNMLQENVPFLLGHPSQKNMPKEFDHSENLVSVEKKDKEFSIHEISFNRDQFSNSMRTDQDTMRSLQLPKHYEMVEEEAEEEGITSKNRDFPLQMHHDRYRESPKELPTFNEGITSPFVIKSQHELIRRTNSEKGVRENFQENANVDAEKNHDTTENQLIALFYQIVNENKFLKQEMANVHNRLDEMSKQKEAETEIICNLQQNLELTMMLLKKRDEEFAKLQKKHDELTRNFESYIDQTPKPPLDYYLGPVKASNYPQPDFDEPNVEKSTRRSSSFTNAVHNSVRMSKSDLRRHLQHENQRSQKGFPTHFSEMHSGYDNDISQEGSVEHRRNSSHTLRTSVQQNLDRKEGNYDTSGDYDSRHGYLAELQNQNNSNKVLHHQMAKKSGFGSQQVIQEREDVLAYNKQNIKGSRKENVGKNWADREQEKAGMKENRYGPNSGNRPSSVEPVNMNNAWTSGTMKPTMERGNEPKLASKVYNYKKYSEMFKRQKEAFDQGNNYQKEDMKGKIQRK